MPGRPPYLDPLLARALLLATLTLCVGAFIAPAPVAAGWRIDRAAAIAAIVWRPACPLRIEWTDAAVAVGHIAQADEPSCTVLLPRQRRLSWGRFCTAVLHETGHLAGYRDPTNLEDPHHSSRPGSVMYRLDQGANTFDDRCDDRGRTYLRRHRPA